MVAKPKWLSLHLQTKWLWFESRCYRLLVSVLWYAWLWPPKGWHQLVENFDVYLHVKNQLNPFLSWDINL